MSEWISPVVDIQSGQYSSRPSRDIQSTTRYECDSGFEKKCGNSWTGTIVVIIVAIILIVMFALIIFYVTRKTEPLFVPINPPNPTDDTKDTTGESDDGRTFVNNGEFYTDSPACNAGRTRRWSQDPNSPNLSCQCVVPFYAPKCDLESFIDTYYAVGNIGEDTLTTSIISQSTVDRLSFPQENPEYEQDGQTMCTNICDGIEDCIGVIYKQADAPNYGIGEGPSSECTLISDMYVNPGNNITYDDMIQADLYLKDGETVKYKDRVFVYMGTLPLRYWLSDRNSDSGGSSWALYHKILYQLPFMPTNIINNTGTPEEEAWVGVFSNQPIPFVI